MANNFIGLDSDFFGDGESDETTKPLSTYKENRLDENTRYLVEKGSNVSWHRRHRRGLSTPEKVGSYYWTNRFLQRLTVYPHDKRIRVYLNGEVGFDGTGDGEVLVRGYLMAGSSAGAGSITPHANTIWDEAASKFYIDIPVAEAVSSPTDCWVCVDVKSDKNGPREVYKRIYNPEWAEIVPGYAFKYEISLGDLDGGQFIEIASSSFIADGHDLLGVFWEHDIGKEPISRVVLYNPRIGAITPAIDEAVYSRPLSYLIQRGWHMEVYSDAGKASGMYGPHRAVEKRAQTTVLGQHVSKHGINMDYYHYRPRIVAMGPSRGSAYNDSWEGGYYSRWRMKQASNANTALMDSTTFSTDLDGCKVVVKGLLFGVHIDTELVNAMDAGETEIEKIHRFNMKWPLFARVFQVGDPDENWANLRIASAGDLKEEEFDLRIFQATPAFNFPLLRQLYHAFQHNIYAERATAYPTDLSRAFHNGVLSDQHNDDRALLTPFQMELKMEAGTYDPQNPLTVSLEAGWANISYATSVKDGFNAQSVDDARVWLGLHSYNITVEPL